MPSYTYNNSNDKQKKSDVHSRKNPNKKHEGPDKLTNSHDKVCAEMPNWLYFTELHTANLQACKMSNLQYT